MNPISVLLVILVAFFAGMGIITLIDFLIPEYENPHEASGLSLDANGGPFHNNRVLTFCAINTLLGG